MNASECGNTATDLLSDSYNPKMTAPLVTFTASSLGNLTAIFVIWRNQRRSDLKSVFYILMMTLALLDLISTWMTSPITFAAYSSKLSVCTMGGRILCLYSGITMTYFGIVTMAIVFTMSVERLIAIRFAFFYHTKINAKKTKLVLWGVLVFFFFFSALPIIGFGEITQQLPGSWCFLNWRATLPQHQIYNLTLVGVGMIMLCGTVFCNIYVIVQVIKKRRRMKFCNSAFAVMSKKKLKKLAANELQMILLLGVMTCVFNLCYLPLLVRMMVTQISTLLSIKDLTSSWDLFAVRMASVNPVLDPWVYILLRPSVINGFFRTLKLILTCKCSKDELGEIFMSGREFKRRRSSKSLQSDTQLSYSHLKRCEIHGSKELGRKYGRVWKNNVVKQREDQFIKEENCH